MLDEGKTFRGSLVLDLRIWWRHVHTLYTGCPLKTGSLRIRLKRVILIFLTIKRPWKSQIAFLWKVENSEIPVFP